MRSFEGSDYARRIICDPGDLTRFFALMALSITYDNFKSAIARHPIQKRKCAAYHDIHHRMVERQDERPPSLNTKPSAPPFLTKYIFRFKATDLQMNSSDTQSLKTYSHLQTTSINPP